MKQRAGTGALRAAAAAAALAAGASADAQRLGYESVADDALAGVGTAGEIVASAGAAAAPTRDTAGTAEQGISDLYLDQVELVLGPGADGYAWDLSAKVGGPVHRLHVASIGEGTLGGSLDYLEMQAFYSRNLIEGWDLQAGLRYDIRPFPNRAWLTLGLQGGTDALNVGAYTFLSHRGELAARFYGLYDIALPGPFVLQPSAEINLFGADIPALGLGRGLAFGEAGLRLRYVVHEDRLAPYAGIEYARSFGRTARFAREAGEDHSGLVFLLGVRSWF